jgi:hypothetical protein
MKKAQTNKPGALSFQKKTGFNALCLSLTQTNEFYDHGRPLQSQRVWGDPLFQYSITGLGVKAAGEYSLVGESYLDDVQV